MAGYKFTRTTTASRRNKAASKLTPEAVYSKFVASESPWTENDALELGQNWSTGPDGPFLRATLALGCQSGKRLLEMAGTSREGAATLAVGAVWADHAVSRLRELANMLEVVPIRVRIALCSRDDMREILAAAESDAFEPSMEA